MITLPQFLWEVWKSKLRVSDKDTSYMKSKSFRQRQLLFVLFTQGVLQNVPDFVITNPQQILGIKWKFSRHVLLASLTDCFLMELVRRGGAGTSKVAQWGPVLCGG